jgi:hypothetical protein
MLTGICYLNVVILSFFVVQIVPSINVISKEQLKSFSFFGKINFKRIKLEGKKWVLKERFFVKTPFQLSFYESFILAEKIYFLNILPVWVARYRHTGKRSLDQISLDIFSWSKFSVNLGVWSEFFNFFLVSWSNFTWSFQLIKSSNNGILGFKKISNNCQNP